MMQPNVARLTRRRIFAALIVAWFCAEAIPAMAQSPKIAYVDVDLVTERSQYVQSQIRAAEEDLKKREDELEAVIRDYRLASEDLSARRSVMSEDEVGKEQKKIEALRDEIDHMRLDIEKQWRRSAAEVMEPAVDRVLQTVREVARERGFDLVLRSDVVLYGVDALDLTSQVVQALDQKTETKGSPALPSEPEATE